jgi:hypothetical protein
MKITIKLALGRVAIGSAGIENLLKTNGKALRLFSVQLRWRSSAGPITRERL